MPCVAVDLPLPAPLPSPLTIAPPAFSAVGDLTFCCKLVTFSVTLPVPIPGLSLTSEVVVLINAALATIQAYIDALPIDCPRDP